MAIMDKLFIGQKAGSVTTSMEFDPVSKVVLYVSDGLTVEAGKDGGQVLEADCPYATQAMANAILAGLKDRPYRPVQATEALLDPASELGDGMTVAGTYSVLASRDDICDDLYTADIGAPGKREPESELGAYKGSVSREMDRKVAETRSLIAKTADEIRAEITGESGAFAQLKLTVEGLQTTVEDVSGKYSALKQTADKIEWLVKGEDSSSFTLTDRMATLAAASINLSGYVTFSNLSGSYNDKLNKTIIDGSLLRTGKIQGLGDGNQSYWNLGTGELVTYKMTAHEMEADGKLTCGTEVQQIKVADGSIHGYGWKGNQHSQSDFGYIDFTGVCHNIDNPNEVWYGIQISSELLRISTDMISVSNTKSTEVTTWAGINSTFKWPYIGKFEQTGFDDAGIPMFKWVNVTAEAQFINGICTKFAVWDGYS